MSTHKTETEMSPEPKVKITPKFAIFDEIVDVEVSNLVPYAPVTVDCSILYYKILYIGFGHFFADENGIVNAGKYTSHGKYSIILTSVNNVPAFC